MKVKFVPQNVEFEIKPGQSVLHVAQDKNIYVKSVCKGVPSCAECRVRVVEGEHNVLPPGSEELSLIGTGHFIDRRRLSCQLKCFGDITVDMHEQIAKQQGLIGGNKKKKTAPQDDRVEDVHVRTEASGDDRTDPEVELSEEPALSEGHPSIKPERQLSYAEPISAAEPVPMSGGRDGNRGGGGNRDRNRNQNQNRNENRDRNRGGGDRKPRDPNRAQAAPGAPGAEGLKADGGEGGEAGARKRRRRRGGRGGGGGGGGAGGQGGGGGNRGPGGSGGGRGPQGGGSRPPS